ncbi:hypothetical protein JHV675_53970 [Mycobacterium avium subsp. hominissuis]
MGVDASPMGMVSTPPLTTVQFDPCAVVNGGVLTMPIGLASTPITARSPGQRSPA